MAAPGQIQSQPIPIPVDIRKDLPDHLTPWQISPGIFSQMSSQKGQYKKVEVLPTDPEWRFVWKYFYHDKPKLWGINRVYCIHERHQQQAFEFGLSSIEREADTFKPNWNEEPRSAQRAQAIERWKGSAEIFSPFNTFESDGRRRNWTKTKILPLWHGTSKEIANSVAETGFVYFGKTSIGTTSSDPKSTDEGFFGSGLYFSNSARYVSDVYSRGHILMAWVSMREPFPVVGDHAQKDMDALKGKGAYKHYNAHYVPVTSIDPSNPYEAMYYPSQAGETPHCDEIVVFHKSQTLPRFWIELTVESPTIMSPSDIPMFVNELIPHLFKILEHSGVDRDQKLRNHLGQELAFLLKLKGDDYLDDHGDKYEVLYGHMTQLIVQGRVNRQISRLITGSNPPPTPTPNTPSMTQQFQQITLQPQTPPHSSPAPSPQPSYQGGPPTPHIVTSSSSSSHINPFSTPSPAPIYSPQIQIAPQTAVPEMAFGKAKWNQYFGDIGTEPPLPHNIEQILNRACIFYPGKKVRDTHLLVLIPQAVNGKAFCLDSLKELIKSPKTGSKTDYRYYDGSVKNELGAKSTSSHWALMTRDVIPNSRSKTYDDQKTLVASHASRSGIPYELPTALDAATAILMEHVQKGNRLYSDDPYTYTRCQEKVNKTQWPVAIGSFSSGGLDVSSDLGYGRIGVGCVQKF